MMALATTVQSMKNTKATANGESESAVDDQGAANERASPAQSHGQDARLDDDGARRCEHHAQRNQVKYEGPIVYGDEHFFDLRTADPLDLLGGVELACAHQLDGQGDYPPNRHRP